MKKFKQGERSLKGKQWNMLYENSFNKIIHTLGEEKQFKIVFNDENDSANSFLSASACALAIIASVGLAF